MHLELCVEDASGKILLEAILPLIIHSDITWKVHGYRGVGHVPKGLRSTDNAKDRIILDNLPKLIRGCANTPHVTALIIIIDADKRNVTDFTQKLMDIHQTIAPASNVIFQLAIEEMEAWLLGDRKAVEAAYKVIKPAYLDTYVQDSICGTWELLADAIHPGGAAALKSAGWPAPGIAKCEWASRIGPNLTLQENQSPSFNTFLNAIRPYSN